MAALVANVAEHWFRNGQLLSCRGYPWLYAASRNRVAIVEQHIRLERFRITIPQYLLPSVERIFCDDRLPCGLLPTETEPLRRFRLTYLCTVHWTRERRRAWVFEHLATSYPKQTGFSFHAEQLSTEDQQKGIKELVTKLSMLTLLVPGLKLTHASLVIEAEPAISAVCAGT
jgi:hypothetical protein